MRYENPGISYLIAPRVGAGRRRAPWRGKLPLVEPMLEEAPPAKAPYNPFGSPNAAPEQAAAPYSLLGGNSISTSTYDLLYA
jgi:hypothetical protein